MQAEVLFTDSVAAQNVVEGEHALEGSAAGTVEDGEQRPAREEVQGVVERHVREKRRGAVWLEGALDKGVGGKGGGGGGEFGGGHRVPGVVGKADEARGGVGFGEGARDGIERVGAQGGEDGDGLEGVFDVKAGLLALLFHGGEVEAVLLREDFKYADGLQAARDEEGQGVGEDDRQNDGVIAADFEHHENRGEGDAQKSSEEDAHANQRVGTNGARDRDAVRAEAA